MRKKVLRWILPGLLVLALDRIVKIYCGSMNLTLIPGVIALRSTRNTGMALGLMQDNALLILICSVALVGLCAWLMRDMRPRGLAPAAISMMAGGALGNMIDRLALGYVVDMFELLFIDFYIFNVADVGVVCGAILCGLSLLFRPQDWSRRSK